MTATTECQPWCEIDDCGGEHRKHTKFEHYIPAIGLLADWSEQHEPRPVPQLGTGIYWDESWGAGIHIILHEHVTDTEYQLALPDALALASRILTDCALASEHLPHVCMSGDIEEWRNFKAATAAIIDKAEAV